MGCGASVQDVIELDNMDETSNPFSHYSEKEMSEAENELGVVREKQGADGMWFFLQFVLKWN